MSQNVVRPKKKDNARLAWPTAVDMYSGCGGVTEGLKNRHFRVVAAIDNDPVACETYRRNHPTTKLYEEDVKKVKPADVRKILPGNRDLDLLVVCSPCQPFSSQRRSQVEDARARLILEAIRFARILKPKVILFENVPGLVRPRFSPLLNELREGLSQLGYFLGQPEELDAADFGVPQRRRRVMMLAKKGGVPSCLLSAADSVQEQRTVAQALAGLPELQVCEADENDPLHFARSHKRIVLERLAHISKDGGSRDELPEHLVLPCHKDHKGHPDVYGRMSWNDVAPTLTTGCTDVTKGRFAHPQQDRAITLREAARLQTFPDDYVFWGNSGEIATQIGNAVPVKFVEALTPVIRTALRDQ